MKRRRWLINHSALFGIATCKAEQLFVQIKSIPRFREKLGCLMFKQEFPLRVHELRCVRCCLC